MTVRIASTTLLTSLAFLAVGCVAPLPEESLPHMDGYENSDDASMSAAEDPACGESIPSFAEVTMFAKCVNCHSSTKKGVDRKFAPTDVNFDTKAAADAAAERAAEMVKAGVMPPRTSGFTVSASEKEQLYAWAMCAN